MRSSRLKQLLFFWVWKIVCSLLLIKKVFFPFFSILQKAYLKYKIRKIKRKKKAGIDPIRTAFDGMKVYSHC